MKLILPLIALLSLMACSDKSEIEVKEPTTTQEQPAPAAKESASDDQTKNETKSPTEIDIAETQIPLPQNLDYRIVPVLTELRNQVRIDPYELNNPIGNVEFANRILEVKFQHKKTSSLELITHTKKGLIFRQTSQNENTQYFEAFEHNVNFYALIPVATRKVAYLAEATTTETKNQTVTILKIRDVEANAVIHILYVKKKGLVMYSLEKGYDYGRELTDTSRRLLERLIEDPDVEGTFYTVITKEPNFSNAYRFRVNVGNDFVMESYPLFRHYVENQPNVVPLKVRYKSFLQTMFFGSAAYSAINEPQYSIEADRNPVELKTLNIDIKLDAHSKTKREKHTVPVRLHFRF